MGRSQNQASKNPEPLTLWVPGHNSAQGPSRAHPRHGWAWICAHITAHPPSGPSAPLSKLSNPSASPHLSAHPRLAVSAALLATTVRMRTPCSLLHQCGILSQESPATIDHREALNVSVPFPAHMCCASQMLRGEQRIRSRPPKAATPSQYTPCYMSMGVSLPIMLCFRNAL